jgi:hypothetical protein
VIVDRLERGETEERVERSARVRWDGGEIRVAIEVPPGFEGESGDASPFLCATLLAAMQLGEDLEIDGWVSPMLLRGCDELRELYRAWAPSLHRTVVRVGEEREPPRRGEEIGSFFSRGVDSTYSAAAPRSIPGRVDRLIFSDRLLSVHGERVRVEEILLAREAAARIPLPLALVSTNIRDFLDPTVRDWEDAVGGALSFVANSLPGVMRAVVVPSTDGPMTVGPAGVGPLVDPRYSTEAVSVHHDSNARSRVAKAIWIGTERPDLVQDLKVCFMEDTSGNCGRCGKCLLTMASLQAAGALGLADQFPDEIDLNAIKALNPSAIQARADWMEAAHALDPQRDSRLQDAILTMLRRPVSRYPGPPLKANTPSFRRRHAALTLALIRDRRPWPPMPPRTGIRGLLRRLRRR